MFGESVAACFLASWFTFWVVVISGQGRTAGRGAGRLRGHSKSGRVPPGCSSSATACLCKTASFWVDLGRRALL